MENLWFSGVLRGYRKGTLAQNGFFKTLTSLKHVLVSYENSFRLRDISLHLNRK